jgi:CRP-like cAMP-binding protein
MTNDSNIIKSLRKFGIYRPEDLTHFMKNIKTRHVSKNEILLQMGQVCQSVFFIESGSLYQYNFKDEIEENVIDLHIESEWVLNHKSFTSQSPSESIIKAFSDSEIIELTIENIHKLVAISPVFLQLGGILESSVSRISFFDNDLTPLKKYQFIIQNRPQLIQAFPLKLIASYLKITPETLSRVREKLAKGTAKSIS